MSNVRFISLDVHAETIAVAAAESTGEVRSLGVIPNRLDSIRKLVKKLGPVTQLRACYEAGPEDRAQCSFTTRCRFSPFADTHTQITAASSGLRAVRRKSIDQCELRVRGGR
jgi:hypothetical protein